MKKLMLTISVASVMSMAMAEINIESIRGNGTISYSGVQIGTTARVEWAASLTDQGRTNWYTLSSVVVTSRMMTNDIPMFFRVIGIPSTNLLEGLVAYYPFNEDAQDYSGHENHGSVHGATLTSGVSSGGYYLDGGSDKIIIPDADAFRFGTNAFSIVAWVQTTQTGNWKRVFTRRSASSVYWYSLAVSEGKSRFETDANTFFESNSNVNDGNWHQIAIVRNPITEQFEMFVDGSFETSMAATGAVSDGSSSIEVGVWGTESYDSGTYNGKIDQIRVYNRALLASEVQELYQLME